MELFKLINLCIEHSREKIVTDIRNFKRKYMNSDNILTNTGVKQLADKLCGYISYLNREQDPTQFAQPIMIEVPVIMSYIQDEELRKDVFTKEHEDKDVKKNKILQKKEDSKKQQLHMKELNDRLRKTQKNMKVMLKERQHRCKTIKNRSDKSKCMQEIKEEIENEIRGLIENIKKEITELKESEEKNKELGKVEKMKVAKMKEKLDTLRNELLQEVMIVERCKHIKLIN